MQVGKILFYWKTMLDGPLIDLPDFNFFPIVSFERNIIPRHSKNKFLWKYSGFRLVDYGKIWTNQNHLISTKIRKPIRPIWCKHQGEVNRSISGSMPVFFISQGTHFDDEQGAILTFSTLSPPSYEKCFGPRTIVPNDSYHMNHMKWIIYSGNNKNCFKNIQTEQIVL